MDEDHHVRTHCLRCGAYNHHTVECVSGDDPIHFDVLSLGTNDSSSVISLGDISADDDLIEFDQDADLYSFRSSHVGGHEDGKDTLIAAVRPGTTCELNPATSNHEAHVQDDLEEAFFRRDSEGGKAEEVNDSCEEDRVHANKTLDSGVEEEVEVSHEEHDRIVQLKAFQKVMAWDAGGISRLRPPRAGPVGRISSLSELFRDKSSEWETKTTPQTLKNREVLPKSSILSLENKGTASKACVAEGRGRSRSGLKYVARTMNPDTNTVTVSSLRQKRRGGRNQPSYYDITPELHYLR